MDEIKITPDDGDGEVKEEEEETVSDVETESREALEAAGEILDKALESVPSTDESQDLGDIDKDLEGLSADDILGAVENLDTPESISKQEIWEPGEPESFEVSDEVEEEEPSVEREVKAMASEYNTSQIESARQFLNKYGIRTQKLSDEQVIEKLVKIQEARSVASQVLSRGRVVDTVDRILDDLPDGLVGEFKRDNDLDISRARALKWEVFIDKELSQQTLTASDDGCVRLGDLILMVIPEEIYVGNRLARADRLAERRKTRKSKERKPSQGDQVMSADPKVPIIQL